MCPAIGTAGRVTRWCPTAEQVMLLEELYKGGLTNPSASQIHQIVAHLSRFGKIQGKNVFYWFQNHKARDKQKIRKKLVRQQQQLVGLQMIQCCNSFNCFTDQYCCKPELALHSHSSSVPPLNKDETTQRKSATILGDIYKPRANARRCGVLVGMQDGGWSSGFARPLPNQPACSVSPGTSLLTLDLFPTTPTSKGEESNKLSCNYINSRASNAPKLLPNPNLILTLGTPAIYQ